MMRLALFLSLLAAGCGVSTQPLEGFDVVIKPTQECTLTGATSRACTDPATLAQQTTKGRWIFEEGANETFDLTTEDGITLPGIYFADDATVLNQAPCIGKGNGAVCYFARRKFSSSDPKNNGCTTFGELVAILLRTADTTFSGTLTDTNGKDQSCGTATVSQNIFSIEGTRQNDASLARQEGDAQ
jgi:hypothetical protein